MFKLNATYRPNQLVKHSSDNGWTFNNLNFPPGVWNYTRIDNYIKEKTKIKNEDDTYKYPMILDFDDSTLRVSITLETNYQLDLTHSEFN